MPSKTTDMEGRVKRLEDWANKPSWLNEPAMTRREKLAIVGREIWFCDWSRPMAIALGPYHPYGPRETVDDRLVRRWDAGDREIPDWVIPALVKVLIAESDLLRQLSKAIEESDLD